MRTVHAYINIQAIRHNYLVAKQQQSTAAWAVLKANAYGHGAIQCARAIADIADGFALATVAEAVELRTAGISQPLIALEGGFSLQEIKLAYQHAITLVINSDFQLALLNANSGLLPIWLKISTGMNRLGYSLEAVPAALQTCSNNNIQVSGLFTHFACSEKPEHPFHAMQLRHIESLQAYGLPISTANSAAILTAMLPDSNAPTRPGIMLYGVSHCLNDAGVDLRPVMSLHAKIIAIRTIDAGESVGYGATWTAQRRTVVATVGCGYGDGYPREITGASVAHAKGIAAIIGLVSMDTLSIDCSNIDRIAIGDSVELWGNTIAVTQVAIQANTLVNTLFACLGTRVEYVYIHDPQQCKL